MPARVKCRTSIGAGRPRLTSSWLNRPALVRSTISRDRSVAVIETRVAALGSESSSSIAIVYGSCPLEQAADQICRRSFGPRAASRAGMTVEVSAVNGSPSRNHDVSFVVSASTMRPHAVGVGPGAHRLHELRRRRRCPRCRAIGSSRASTRYSLPGWSTIALSLCTSARTQSKLVAVSVIGLLRQTWRRPGGGDAGQVAGDGLGDAVQRQDLVGEAGLADGAGHAPDDRGGLVLDDHGAAGGADLAGAVAAVGAHAGQDDGQDGAVVGGDDRAEQRVDGRAAEVLRRALVEAGVQAPRAVADDQVVVAGGEVDGAGQQRAAVGGLDDAQRAEPVEPLGELAGEDRRHVLDDAGPARAGTPGSWGSTLARASGPPVEEPITRTAGFLPGPVRGAAGRGGGDRAAARAGPTVTGRPVSALIFGISCSRTLSIDWPTLPTLAGLVT